MNQQFEVLVTGGGVVGLTAALAMAQCGYCVALIDAGNLDNINVARDARVYAINKASQSLLEELDVWRHLDKQRLSPYRKMYVWDAQSGAAIDFDSRTIAAAHLGFIIEEAVLKNALLEQIKLHNQITLFPHCAISDVQQLESHIQINNEHHTWQGQLLIIAEGAHSPTREKLGVRLTTWSYQQRAIVATVHTEQAHNQTAYQVFHPDGPLALLPLIDKNQCSIVWSIDTKDADELMQLNDEDFNQALTHAFMNKLGKIELVSERHQFPLSMRHAQNYVGKHWLLLGDAAHTIHPLAGLGLNIGLADVAVCYRQLKENKKTLCSPKSLSAYQRERKTAVWETILLMEGFKRIFSYSSHPISGLRGLGLSVCNHFTPLKRLFIQHAAGE